MRTIERAVSFLGNFYPDFAWSMFWQSSVLIGLLLLVDFALGRKLRPVVRYGLWLLVLVKLALPPTLALPTGIAWWVRPPELPSAPARNATVLVRYDEPQTSSGSTKTLVSPVPPPRTMLTPRTWLVLSFLAGAPILFAWMLLRWRQVAVAARCATPAPDELQRLLRNCCDLLRFRSSVRLRMTGETTTPVVFGFLRPVILLPASLPSRLTETQLRAVLLHELIHLRRGDVWVNCVQTLVQMAYWWHPLLWLANARIRRAREEAVDDAVMFALEDEQQTYPQALLEVAKLALGRPLSSLALVGILETRQALRRRIERLVNLPGRPKNGLPLASMACLVAFGALALPMGRAPFKMAKVSEAQTGASQDWPDPRFPGYAEVSLSAHFLIVEPASLELFLPSLAAAQGPLVLASNELANLEQKLAQADAQSFPRNQSLSFAQFSGGRFHYRVGGVTGNVVDYQTQTRTNGSTFVTGAECASYVAGRPDWVPLDFTVVPWTYRDSTLCQVRLGTADDPESAQQTEVTIPAGGAMLWRVPGALRTGKSEFVVLKEGKPVEDVQSKPSPPEPKPAPETEKIARLVQDAHSSYDAGKLDDAEASLRKALAIDHDSPAAHYYLGLVSQARANQPPPVRPLAVETNQVPGSTSREGILAMLSRIRLGKISFDSQPLSEVLMLLNNEVSPVFTFRLDAGSEDEPQGAGELRHYPAVSNHYIGNVPIRILPALTDVRLGDVLDAIVKVAPERIRYSIETNGVVFSSARGQAKPMYTRVLKIDPEAFLRGLEAATGETNIATAFQSVLRARGLDLQPPETFFLSDGNGFLLLRTTLEKLDPIEKLVSELVTPPAQLNIKTRFLRLPDSVFNQLRSTLGIAQTQATNASKILTPAQTAVVLRALNTKDNSGLINSASVTLLSGRQAEVECVDLHSAVSNNVPVQIPLGPAVDLIPTIGTEGWKISLRIAASLREFLGYDGSLPRIRLKQLKTDATVPDGYTLVLINPVDENGEPAETPGAAELHYVVLITPTVIDRAGNRVHTDAEIEALSQ